MMHPEAKVIAHPECLENLLELADYVGSTSKLLEFTEISPCTKFIVLTEPGILHQMKLRMPKKEFMDVPGIDGCSCNECPYMRLNTLEKLWSCLSTMKPSIEIEEEVRQKALIPIQRMLNMKGK